MNAKSVVIPVAALALALGSFADATAQSAERRNRGNQRQERAEGDDSARPRGDQGDRSRNAATRRGQGAERTERAERVERSNRGDASQDRERQRASASERQRDNGADRASRDRARGGQRRPEVAQRDTRDYRGSNDRARTQGRDDYRSYDRGRDQDRGSYDRGRDQGRGGYDRRDSRDYRGGYSSGYSRGYYAPRRLQYRSAPRRYYGSGGRLTLYFGIGSGYRYGSPYSGRVYGYRRSVPTYGDYVAYGDLRLKVSPRHASVYVDGYYAGVVDDFDGFFQRLTLEVGPHEIEVEAPGYGSQVFDVYVDPERTIDLHADLLR